MKNIKEIEYNKNINNTNGVFQIGCIKYFYKILNEKEFKMEKIGYDKLNKYYKLPRLISLDKKNKIVIYEYNEINKKNKGLLVDYFASNNFLTKEYYGILNEYKDVFDKTINYTKKGNCKIFFEDRLKTRLKKNIEYIKNLELDNKEYIFNGKKVIIKPLSINEDINNYFKKINKEWCVISNCDPNDLNICMDHTMFDYTGGGNVPLMSEFAVFTCYNLIQGEYLSLKYNKKAFKNHDNIYKYINKCNFKSNNINHKPRKIRIDAIEYYAKNIIAPILKKKEYVEWYNDFKNYFAIKLLAVFNFDKMNKKDIELSLCYMQLFYEAKINSINGLLKFIKKMYE